MCLKMLDNDVAAVVYTVTNYLQNAYKSAKEAEQRLVAVARDYRFER